jgi:protein-tyrosine phosphatase
LIDLHCHILPGVDDGPASIEESLEMAKQAVADGIQTLVATPHTLNEVYHNPLQNIEDNVNRLRKAFRKNRININLCTGSEVRICTELKQKVIAKEVATLNNNGRYILVEFPVHVIPPGSKEELFQLTLHNITPILAHPERNLVFQHQPELLSDLTAMGCLIQLTAMSITGRFGQEAMECAHMLLKNRQSHVIATDAHSPDSRPPILSLAVEASARILGNLEEAHAMVNDRPQAILAGEPVKALEPKPLRQKKWWFNWSSAPQRLAS